jgi:hypothetical protein
VAGGWADGRMGGGTEGGGGRAATGTTPRMGRVAGSFTVLIFSREPRYAAYLTIELHEAAFESCELLSRASQRFPLAPRQHTRVGVWVCWCEPV